MQQEPEAPQSRSKKAPAPSDVPSARSGRAHDCTDSRASGLTLVVLLVIEGVGLGGADYYTIRPSFCGTCHVMDPYYESWSHDLHGVRLGVLCVDCHYAPGERFTIHARFKGLSQVASYFSGRYGAGRPRAHVADESCLVSGCHGQRDFMSKLLPIGEPRMETRVVEGMSIPAAGVGRLAESRAAQYPTRTGRRRIALSFVRATTARHLTDRSGPGYRAYTEQ